MPKLDMHRNSQPLFSFSSFHHNMGNGQMGGWMTQCMGPKAQGCSLGIVVHCMKAGHMPSP